MATSRSRPRFIITDLLQLLRVARARGELLTTDEIRDRLLRGTRRSGTRYWEYYDLVDQFPLFEADARLLNDLLYDLQSIGIVSNNLTDSREIRDGQPRWWFNASWEGGGGDIPVDGGGGRGDVPPPGSPDNAGGGDGGAGGIGEVLAHPYLFAVSPEDFADAIDRALGTLE